MGDEKETLTAKAVGLGVALAFSWVAQQVVSRSWKAAVGHEPPKPENPGEARLGEVVVAAAITGALVYLSRVLATRGTARLLR